MPTIMKRVVIITAFCAATAAAQLFAAPSLEDGFKAPPDSAKPHTWYHMMNGNVTKEGITCDFEALAKAGIGGVQMFDAGCAIPPGPLKFNSDDWFDMFAHAHKEAKRLGLEICIPNCSGWSSSGGPWNPPANGMKVIRFTETKVKGPRSRWSATLPREKNDNGFYDDIAVLAYPTPKGKAKISNLPEKMFAKRGNVKRDTKPVAEKSVVAKDAVVDLTAKMKKDGTLEWDVPAGDWTILRVGYICNGRCNHPASEKGKGLEVDKLSASAMDYHFAQYVTRLCKTLGIEPGKIGETGFNNILVDSYEVDVQNWTQGFDKTFEKRMGYSLTRYLPVFAGRIVGSVEESERFLEDFRRVVADLFAENYAGRLTELCHQHGLLCSIEPYGNCPADNLQYGQDIDIPMAEYWSTAARGAHHSGGIGNSRLAATLAHVWGRRYAATESFTASPGAGGRWLTTPYHIKAQGDKVFAAGVNRIIYHRFTHQPWPGNKYLPGMTMGRWGMHLDRTQTWWPLAGDWFRYQARCQWMLQEGMFAADVLFWCGEEVPLGGTDTKLPAGYGYDYCATKAFLQLKVENGRVVVPGGVSYALLVLPNTDTMSEVCVKKVGELLEAGAKISCVSRPVRTPGLRGWKNDGYKGLVASVWAKGVIGKSAGDALASLGIAPDFICEQLDVSWIHRTGGPRSGAAADAQERVPPADWYFVALDNAAPVKFEASFRQTGRIPEVWDAETGSVRDASAWREENGRTIVSLDYNISGSSFVVFRRAAAGKHATGVNATVSARPDPKMPEKRHTLVIKKAEYGVFGSERPNCADVSKIVRPGVPIVVNNATMGGDPAVNKVKQLEVRYTTVRHGQLKRDVVDEGSRYTLLKGTKLIGAWYGLIDPEWNPPVGSTVIDVTDKLASLVKDGEIDVVVENDLAGRDPLFRTVKKMVVTYVYDGREFSVTLNEHERFKLPANKLVPPPPPDWDWRRGEIVAWQPLAAEIAFNDGTKKSVSANPPACEIVSGPWEVSFPAGWDAPASATFDSLVPWNEHKDNGIKYFSGTATYRKNVKCKMENVKSGRGGRIMLDLGVVKDFAEVTVNGTKFPVLWKPPFRLDITDAVKGAGAIDLEVKVTNLWPNRLIGDDILYENDCEWAGKPRRGVKEFGVKEIPQWVRDGKPSPTGRHTFTTWRHWSKEDDLLPSGLIGLVVVRFGEVAATDDSAAMAAVRPSEAHLKYQDREIIALVCWGLNPYTGQEWGFGNVPTSKITAKKLDPAQWADAMKAAEISCVVLVAKHHDGFCLWPSPLNKDYSMSAVPAPNTGRDLVRELADACRARGMKFGVYLSPWDRHQGTYATPAYVDYFFSQWNEVLDNYGEISEIWLDGANGGTGWYGGVKGDAGERRSIPKDYYRLNDLLALMHRKHPLAIAFGGGGDWSSKWCGNERGVAPETWWCPRKGSDGKWHWTPSETDFPLRRGWYWHENESPKSLARLVKIYYESVGRGSVMDIGIAPDTDGQVCEADTKRLAEFGEWVRDFNSRDFAKDAAISESRDDKRLVLDIALAKPAEIDCVDIMENIAEGQRVASFVVEAPDGKGGWRELVRGTTVGHRRLARVAPAKYERLRVTLEGIAPPQVLPVALRRGREVAGE